MMNPSNQSATRRCRDCGAPLGTGATGESCLRCALGNALEPPSRSNAVPFAVSENDAAQIKPGDPFLRHFGDYELLEEIARGGMGVVYRARQVSLDRIVAVKMILFGPLASAEQVRRFRTEASAAGCLQHPNIVAIHEVGLHEKQHYLAMDYVDGPNLGRLVHQGPLSAKRAAGYVKVIAEAVHYAHERGILHRDLKPSNVLIDSDDRPRVVDFGLAKRFTADSSLTLSGQVLGSPSYMPPEQAGAGQVKVGRHSDVYSLGAILYHLLTGRPPFQAETVAQTLNLLTSAEPLSPRLLNPGVPRDLETIALKCLEKEPSKRYPTGQALADELGRFLGNEPIQARPASRTEKLWRWCKRKPALAGSLAAVVILLTVVAIGSSIAVVRVRREQQKVAVQARQLGLNLYAADIYLVQNAMRDGNYGLAQQALQAHFPKQGEPDLRGFEWCYFWKLSQGDKLAAWRAHSYVVSSVVVSPNAKLIASTGPDGQTKLWDAASHALLAVIPEAAGVAFSANGDLLFTASNEGLVQIFKIETRERLATFMTGNTTRDRPVVQLAASPTEPILAVCTEGSLFGGRGSVRLYDYLTYEELGRLTNSGDRMAFSGDGKILVTGSSKEQINVWDVATRKRLKTLSRVGGLSSLASLPMAGWQRRRSSGRVTFAFGTSSRA